MLFAKANIVVAISLRRLITSSTAAVWAPATVCLAWGSAAHGALALPSFQDQYEPAMVPHLPDCVTRIGAGHWHSMAVTANGELWTWGRAREHQLGRDALSQQEEQLGYSSRPMPVPSLHSHVISTAAGSGVATFAVTTDGTLLCFGSSKRGQLGIGEGITTAMTPRRVDVPGIVTQVAAGWGHALAVTENGEAYAWGWPAAGRLGHSFASSLDDEEEEALSKRCIWEPRRIDMLQGVRVAQVGAGMDTSYVVTADGDLFSFGAGDLGQLGRPPRSTGEHVAPLNVYDCQVAAPPSCGGFSRVAAGLGHCVAVMKDGSTATWGWNIAGQCGHQRNDDGEDNTIVSAPKLLRGISGRGMNTCVAAGRVHSIVLSGDENDRRCMAFGSDLNGRLGTARGGDCDQPTEVDCSLEVGNHHEWVDAACGMDHTLVLMNKIVSHI